MIRTLLRVLSNYLRRVEAVRLANLMSFLIALLRALRKAQDVLSRRGFFRQPLLSKQTRQAASFPLRAQSCTESLRKQLCLLQGQQSTPPRQRVHGHPFQCMSEKLKWRETVIPLKHKVRLPSPKTFLVVEKHPLSLESSLGA